MEKKIITFLRRHIGERSAVVGLSGGVDSSVVAFLLAKALPRGRIFGLVLPSQLNQPSDKDDALAVAQQLAIHSEVIFIDPIIEVFQKSSDFFRLQSTTANLQARVRMCLLYGKANAVGGLVVGTGNKSELLTGYFTKYGDGGVDLLPLGDVYKTEVWELARRLGVPQAIIKKTPSAGLWAGQTDKAELGLSYKELDAILQTIEEHADHGSFPQEQVERVQQLMEHAQHKLATAAIARIS